MRADALHKATVAAPQLWEVNHVMVGGAVNGAPLVVDALVRRMHGAYDLTEVVLPSRLCVIEKSCHEGIIAVR